MLIWYRGHFLASLVSIIGCVSSIYGAFLMVNTPADEDYTKGVILIVIGLVLVLVGYIIKASDDRGNPSAVKISESAAYLNAADLCKMKNDTEGEITALKKALEVSNDSALTWGRLGDTYVKTGNKEDALRCYQKAITIKADYAEAYMKTGWIYDSLGKVDEAHPYMTKAVATMGTTNPKYHSLLCDAALIAGKAGDSEKMEQYLNQLIDMGYEDEAETVREKLSGVESNE
ncbi:MAG: tetratricopeptide repeat protein [Clostridia bacterium]|nr:tetratricopeptide repeat protein [Clostridia bacterium]